MAKKPKTPKEKSPEELKIIENVNAMCRGNLIEAFDVAQNEIWVVKVRGEQVQLYSGKEFFNSVAAAKLSLLNEINYTNKFHNNYNAQGVEAKIPRPKWWPRKDLLVWGKSVRDALLASGQVTIERMR